MKCWTILATLVLVSSAQANLRPLLMPFARWNRGNPDAVGDAAGVSAPIRSSGPTGRIPACPASTTKSATTAMRSGDDRLLELPLSPALARATTNPGPRTQRRADGHRKAATLPYWHKVARELRAQAVSSADVTWSWGVPSTEAPKQALHSLSLFAPIRPASVGPTCPLKFGV